MTGGRQHEELYEGGSIRTAEGPALDETLAPIQERCITSEPLTR